MKQQTAKVLQHPSAPKKAQAPPGPTLVPGTPKAGNPKKFKDKFIPLVSEVKALRGMEVEEELLRRQELKAEISEREGELKRINESLLLSVRDAAKLENVRVERGNGLADLVLQVRHGRSASRVDPGKLLDEGVLAQTISKCTVVGKPYDYIFVEGDE